MTYRITGLDPAPFASLFGAADAMLAQANAVRTTATCEPGFPCRVTLEEAAVGETLLLLPWSVPRRSSPYSFTYAIFVRETAAEAAVYEDALPPVLRHRWLSVRAFDERGMARAVELVEPGQADDALRRLLDEPSHIYIDIHNAAAGCFAARAERI